MVRNAIEYGWDGATALLDRKPRKAAIGNVLVLSVMGVVMGLTLYWVTSNYTRNLDKAWIYAINTVIAMIIKVAFQWLMVLIAQPRVVYPVAKRIIPRRYWHLLSMMEGRSHETTVPTNMTVTAVATMILATELSRENVLPILFVDSSHAVWVVTLMGGVTAALEGLSVPQTIFALWHNRPPAPLESHIPAPHKAAKERTITNLETPFGSGSDRHLSWGPDPKHGRCH